MCGIVGVLTSTNQINLVQDLCPMVEALHHRGPDHGDVWCSIDQKIAIGHRRLSVLDLSPSGKQPMVSHSGRYIIAFNGEIYNHIGLRRDLPGTRSDISWQGHSDTETLLAAVETWGLEKTLQRCKGMFAFALWDCKEQNLYLARDRMGEKPLYYGWLNGTFVFASELKALKAYRKFNADISRESLALFLKFNYIPAPHSIYAGINKLIPGTWFKISHEGRESGPHPYWSLFDVAMYGEQNPYQGSLEEATDDLETHLRAAVKSQMLSDVPLGALLSGGLDSTAIVSMMQSASSRPVQTFTISFDEKEQNEAHHAKAVANILGTDHTEVCLTADQAFGIIPKLPGIYDEPFADSSQIPTRLVMEVARRDVTVALSGDGGDEIFGGYRRYWNVPRGWRTIRWLPYPLRHLIGNGLSINPIRGSIAGQLKNLAYRLRHVQSIEDLFGTFVTEWPEAEHAVKTQREADTLVGCRALWPDLADPVHKMMAMDSVTYLPDDILVKVDRAAMDVSLETRAPFLDHKLIEFAWTLPMEMKIKNNQGKMILKNLVNRYVPADIMDRPKQGFGVPLDQWLRQPLREWAEDLLNPTAMEAEGFLEPKPIQDLWKSHLAGGSFGYKLWSVLSFQAWLREQ